MFRDPPTLFSDGFFYFVIFMVVHTKYIWFFHLVAKSDLFNVFQQFQAHVECQFF